MNKFITLITLVFLITSCSNNENYESKIHMEAVSEVETISTEDAYSILIEDKLRDYFEKQKITKNHPEFNTKLNKDRPLLLLNDSIKSITVIDKVPNEEFDSISLKTIVSYYSDNKTDTIFSKIKRSKILIESEEIISSKVIFARDNN